MTARRLLLFCVALILLLAAGAGVVAAQAPAPDAPDAPAYSLTWWTVDGGGASYASGGGYTLGGTAGQPDAAAERSSGGRGDYALRAGFWLPSCSAAMVDVTIALGGEVVTLSWTGAANEAYQLHRFTSPYFAPTDATRHAWVTAGPWPDPGSPVGVGDPNLNYFYLVRPTCGAAYVDAGRMGEFDFALVPGSP